MIRVLIADDHAIVRQGLRSFLDLQDDIEVVGEAGDGAEALAAAERLAPDVVLVDLVMPNVDGIEAIRGCGSGHRARAIVLSSFVDDEKLFPAVRAGAGATCSRTSSRRSWSRRSGPSTAAARSCIRGWRRGCSRSS